MPKIIKNGKEYSGVPLECVTAWQPTGDPVQVAEPLMGNTDISDIGDGTITGAISAVDAGFIIEEATLPTVTIPANSNIYDQAYNLPTVTGYTPWIVGGFWMQGGGYASCGFARLVIDGNQLKYAIFNASSSSASITARAKVVYKRN